MPEIRMPCSLFVMLFPIMVLFEPEILIQELLLFVKILPEMVLKSPEREIEWSLLFVMLFSEITVYFDR